MISIVINCDTRPERNENKEMFSGVVDRDFLTDGVRNKIKFFEGFDKEIILFIDEHENVPREMVDEIREMVDVLVIRKHNKKFGDMDNYSGFNDFNYINALQLTRGTHIFHFDGDVAAYTNSRNPIDDMIKLLDTYDYISYPSHWSPAPDINKNYNYWWCSTRFFCCKRETLDFSEIIKCQLDYDYMFNTYPASIRNHWLEHVLGVTAKFKGKGVFYPPIEEDKYMIWTWENYEKRTLRRLNLLPYEDVKQFVLNNGGIHYPNNLTIK
jgi:hypothetical protein